MLLQTQAIAMTAAAVVRERETGTMEQLLVTPIRPGELLLGKTAPNIVIAMINMLTIVGAGIFIFGVPFRGSLALFVALSLIYVFSGLGLGLLVSTVSDNLKQAQQLVMLILMLGVILSGFMFPRYTMPPVLRLMGNLFPMTFFIPIARGLITKGVGFDAIWRQTITLAVYSVTVLVVAALVFRRGLE
jgi:ABC-2 type transport system permease protein